MSDKPKDIDELFESTDSDNVDYSIFQDEIKDKKTLDEMNAKHSFIRYYDSRPMVQCEVYSSVHEKKIIEFIEPGALITQYSNKTVEYMTDKGSKAIELGKWWIKHPSRKEYETIIFNPQQPREYLDCFNLWEGLTTQPKRGSWKHTRKHIWRVLCNGNKEKFKYVIKWFAWLIQNPHERAEICLVFKGKQGAGKGLVMTQFVEIFGRHGMQITNRDHLTGKFSGHLKLVVFLFADEAYYPGDKDVEGQLNALITEHKITREAKFAHPVLDKNRLHIAMATNNDWIIPARGDSRRYFVNEVDNRYAKNQISNRERKVYFDRLWGEMGNGGRESMLYDLLKINLSGWHPRDDVPETDELKRQREMGVPKVDKWVCSILQEGFFPGIRNAKGHYVVGSTEMMEYMERIEPECKKSSYRARIDALKKLGVTGERDAERRFLIFPSLQLMRENWNEKFAPTIWEHPGEAWIISKSQY